MTKAATNYYILIPAWGKRYVARALDYCLSSLMSPGNAGALLADDRVTFVFLTEHGSEDFYSQHRLLQNLPPGVAVKFVWIDDLIIPPSYGVTLTLAYARAIMQVQDLDPAPIFVFANADFVFSDGALAYIGRIMNTGADGIACPSVRCVEDHVLARIDACREPDGSLDLSAEFLIEQVYDYPHMTDLAATLNNRCLHHTDLNHLYIGDWETELVGFWYLRFMLAIRPVRKLDRVHCFCDYSFMAQMVPADRIDYPEDARDVFLLELSDANQEQAYVFLGTEKPPEIAARVQRFTTAFHRECARHPYFLERNPLPDRRAALGAEAQSAAHAIESRFTIPPHDWRNHPYWHGARLHLRIQGYRLPAEMIDASQSEFGSYPSYLRNRLVEAARSLQYNLRVLKSGIALVLLKPLAKLVFVNFFLRPLPLLRDLRATLREGDVLVLSSFKLAEYLCAFSDGDAVLVNSNYEMQALLKSRQGDILKVVFLGDINHFFDFRTTVAQRFAAKIDVIREVVIVPNHISNRQMEMLLDGTMKAELTRNVSISPGGDHLVKAEAILQIFNRVGGFSLVSRICALLTFMLETMLVEPVGRLRRMGRPRLWNIMMTRPRAHVPVGRDGDAGTQCHAQQTLPHKEPSSTRIAGRQ
jgi:hypothetical protein